MLTRYILDTKKFIEVVCNIEKSMPILSISMFFIHFYVVYLTNGKLHWNNTLIRNAIHCSSPGY